jgi:hypothetical protein
VRFRSIIAAILAMAWAGIPAWAADAARPDPLLQGPMPGPCIAALDGPDYVPGLDANGQPVARADIGAERVPVPGDLLVPLPGSARAGRGGRGPAQAQGDAAYMTLSRDRIDRLVNPPDCPVAPERR